MATIDQARFQALVIEGLSKVFEDGKNQLLATSKMRNKLYKNFPSDKAFDDFNAVGGLPDIVPFNGSLTYADVAPGFHTRIEPAEFALGAETEKKFWLNNLYPVLKDLPAQLIRSSERFKEKTAIGGYANLNSTAFQFMQSEEGVAIASTAHLTKDTTVITSAGGFSNLGTSAFSPTSVEATRILMRGFRDHMGEYINVNPNGFLGPTTLDQKFEEVTRTPKGLYTADHTVNVQEAKNWQWETHQYLNDFSTKNWFMIDWDLLKEYALWIDRVSQESTGTIDFETKKIKASIYDYFGYGFTGWNFIFMQVVS